MQPHDPTSPADPALLSQQQQQQIYWARTQRLTAWLLLIWLLVSFGITYFARQLSFTFFGWPFSFWVASQGALVVFCAIVAFYAYAMRRLDEAHRPPLDQSPPPPQP
jgi:putative solute:sodium symporter small subunit